MQENSHRHSGTVSQGLSVTHNPPIKSMSRIASPIGQLGLQLDSGSKGNPKNSTFGEQAQTILWALRPAPYLVTKHRLCVFLAGKCPKLWSISYQIINRSQGWFLWNVALLHFIILYSVSSVHSGGHRSRLVARHMGLSTSEPLQRMRALQTAFT